MSARDYIEAETVEDFVHKTNLSDPKLLDRVLLPGREFGPYRILGFIAAGGMGEIYAAGPLDDDQGYRNPIALKVINPEHADDWRIIERFKREASIAKAIRSPNVIKVYEYGETEDKKAYLSMELLRGEELFERLCRVRTLAPDDLADLALQVLRGLGDIHRSGFIHRDIKPENIFLAKQPGGHEVAKILDFGIAKRRSERSDPLLSVAGQIYGTPEYLAPEQANHPDVDPRADLYSVGVMLYEAATGSLPFPGDTSYSVIAAHQNDALPPLPSTVDPAFAEIIYMALAKNPKDRFQSAEEMASIIENWRDQTSWVEEIPGGNSLAFGDVFDTHDIQPEAPRASTRRVDSRPAAARRADPGEPIGLAQLNDPKFYLDEHASADAAGSGAEAFEKLSVTKARERRRRQAQQRQTPPRKRQPADSPLDAPTQTAKSGARNSTGTHPRPKPDAAPTPGRGARVAYIVTWIVVIIIVAAIAWTFYKPADTAEPVDSPADPASAAPADAPK